MKMREAPAESMHTVPIMEMKNATPRALTAARQDSARWRICTGRAMPDAAAKYRRSITLTLDFLKHLRHAGASADMPSAFMMESL